MIVDHRCVESRPDHPMTLEDVEAFCRMVREQGGSDDDEVRVPLIMGWAPVRGLKVTMDLGNNREQAHRRDSHTDIGRGRS